MNPWVVLGSSAGSVRGLGATPRPRLDGQPNPVDDHFVGRAARGDLVGRDAAHGHAGWYVMDHDGVGTDGRARADCHATDDARSRADPYVVAYRGVLLLVLADGAVGVQSAVLAHYGVRADDDGSLVGDTETCTEDV